MAGISQISLQVGLHAANDFAEELTDVLFCHLVRTASMLRSTPSGGPFPPLVPMRYVPADTLWPTGRPGP